MVPLVAKVIALRVWDGGNVADPDLLILMADRMRPSSRDDVAIFGWPPGIMPDVDFGTFDEPLIDYTLNR